MTQEQYDTLLALSEPNPFYNLDWSVYSVEDFMSTFIPKVNTISFDGVFLKDSAKLLPSNVIKSRVSPDYTANNYTIHCVSFPKDAIAHNALSAIKLKHDELALLFVIDIDDVVMVHTFLGDTFKRNMERYSKKTLQRSYSHTTNVASLAEFFDSSLSQKKLVNYIRRMSGVDSFAIPNRLYFDEIEEALKTLENDFDAGTAREKTSDEFWAHGDIEKQALKGIFSETEINQIYYGNWLRDYSSVITGNTVGFSAEDIATLKKEPTLKKSKVVKANIDTMHLKLSQYTWSRIVKVLSVKEFQYNQHKYPSENYWAKKNVETFNSRYGDMTVNMLGVYRPEEHIDNPKGLIDESVLASSLLNDQIAFSYEYPKGTWGWKKLYEGPASGSINLNGGYIKPYINQDLDGRPSSLTYVKQQLMMAASYGRGQAGYRHLGAAFHVMEDYFAHTNFVEIALIKNGYVNVYPWVELSNEVKNEPDPILKACKIPLVTGYFGYEDMVASLAPKIADEFFPTKIEDYKVLKSGERSFFDVLFSLVVDDFIIKEINVPKSKKTKVPGTNYTFPEIKEMYASYLLYRDVWLHVVHGTWVSEQLLVPYDKLVHYLGQSLKLYPNIIFNTMLKSTSSTIKHNQSKKRGYGSDPSHTQLAKDSTDHFFNYIAGRLAYEAVKKVGELMVEVWDSNLSIQYVINRVENELFQHPCNFGTLWVDPIISEWAEDHQDEISKSESKTIIEHYEEMLEKNISLTNEEIIEYINALLDNPYLEDSHSH